MFKKSKLILLGIICAIGIPIAASAAIVHSNKTIENPILQKYVNKDEKKVKLILEKLNKNQLIDEVNAISTDLGAENESTSLLPFVAELYKRVNKFENQEITKIVNDNTNAITTRAIMVDLYTVKNEKNDNKNELKKFLKQSIPNEVKVKIITASTFDETDIELLKYLIEQDDDNLTFQSLKKLSKVDSKEAYSISENILSNYNIQSPQKISAAQKATVQYLRDNKIEHKDKFISLCLDILNHTKDPSLKDSSVFALSDLYDKESILKVIKNDSIDRELKVFSIDQNYMIINEILLNNPSEGDIDAVVKAMEIMPIRDLIEPLKNVKENINNTDLEKRCNDVLATMELEGHKGNVKWLDKNNNGGK
jgi:hypothetical protein